MRMKFGIVYINERWKWVAILKENILYGSYIMALHTPGKPPLDRVIRWFQRHQRYDRYLMVANIDGAPAFNREILQALIKEKERRGASPLLLFRKKEE